MYQQQHFQTLRAGTAIVNNYRIPGTLGCFAYVNGQTGVVMLSTYHVLFGRWGKRNDKISLIQNHENGLLELTAIGETFAGKLGTVSYRGDRYYIDCAIGKLSNRWSACNKLSSVNIVIKGIAEAAPGDRVKKLGVASGLTRGIVADVNYPDEAYIAGKVLNAPNQILIKPCYDTGSDKFSMPGDSGAVILNEQNKIIGLLWGSNSKGEGIACHIGPIIQELNLAAMIDEERSFKKFFCKMLKILSPIAAEAE